MSTSIDLLFNTPIIQEEMAKALVKVGDLKSLMNLRLIGGNWPEAVFKQLKTLALASKMFTISRPDEVKRFMQKVSPEAWIPICFETDMHGLAEPATMQLVDKYSHLLVAVKLTIRWWTAETLHLVEKLKIFQDCWLGQLRHLVVVITDCGWVTTIPDDCEAGLNEISQLLAGSRTPELETFKLSLDLSWCEIPKQFTLPRAITQLSVSSNFLGALEGESNVLPQLEVLQLEITQRELDGDLNLEREGLATRVRNVLERHGANLKKLEITSLNVTMGEQIPIPLSISHLPSLEEIRVTSANYLVESIPGTELFPKLRVAEIKNVAIDEKVTGASLISLMKALQHAPWIHLTSEAFPLSAPLTGRQFFCATFSSVTKLDWTISSDVLDDTKDRIFTHMTALKELSLSLNPETNHLTLEIDLSTLLAGHGKAEIPEDEKLWETALNGRTDVVTNLTKLKSLSVRAWRLKPLVPFLFRAALMKLANLKMIQLSSWSLGECFQDHFIQVQDEVCLWRQAGREIIYRHGDPGYESEVENSEEEFEGLDNSDHEIGEIEGLR